MTFVTLEIGPTWRMQLLRGLLAARGLPAVVQDDSLSVYLGDAPSTARLQVPEDVVESARTAVTEARRDGSRALAELRFGLHERFSAPRPLRAMLLDVAFWLVLFLTAFWVFSKLFF
jgi:hypothetical protein